MLILFLNGLREALNYGFMWLSYLWRALENIGERAIHHAVLEHVGVHHEVQQRALDNHVATALDEPQFSKLAEIHVQAGFLAQYVAKIGQQGTVRNAD